MKEHGEVVLGGNALHEVHYQLVVVVGQVHIFEDRSQLELVRSRFVVAGLDRDTELVAFHFQFLHEVGYTRRDRTEVVVVQLLVLRRGVAHQGAAGDAEVRAGIVKGSIYQEVFLFPAQVGIYSLHFWHEHLAHFGSSLVDSSQCLEQWSLVVECLSGVRDKDGRDTQGLVDDEGRRRYIPSGISACFERVADTPVREARCIRFLLDEQLARESFDDVAIVVEFDESVVLLGRAFSKGLEPVCIVSYIICLCPALHAVGNHVGHFSVEGNTFLDGIDHSLVSFARKEFLHLLTVEYMGTVIVG